MIDPKDFQGVVVLYNETSSLIKGEQKDLIADQGVISCAEAAADALISQGIQTRLIPIHDDPELVLADFKPNEWLIFNLAEGLGGKTMEEARIAWFLELKGYFFTGSNGKTLALTTNKALTKYYLSKSGLATPPWWLFHSTAEISPELSLPFPLFVKPNAEDASLGIENDSVVTDISSLRERVDYVLHHYQQSALVEEFIPGREFNIAAWGDPPELLPLAEIDFREISGPSEMRIVNYDAKWRDDSYEFHHTPAICPAEVSSALNRKLSHSALYALKCIGINTYARVDMRLSEYEDPYILEINCNPDLSPGAGFSNTAISAGISFQEMILRILSLARRYSDEYRPVRRKIRQRSH